MTKNDMIDYIINRVDKIIEEYTDNKIFGICGQPGNVCDVCSELFGVHDVCFFMQLESYRKLMDKTSHGSSSFEVIIHLTFFREELKTLYNHTTHGGEAK